MSTSQKYELIKWTTFVFLGGAINAVVLQAYINFLAGIYRSIQPPAQIELTTQYIIIGILPLVFMVPVILSLLLSQLHPEKRIVPPLYMQIIAFAWIIIFGYNQWPVGQLGTIYLLSLLYTVTGGVYQDAIVTGLIGYTVESTNMFQASLRVYSTLNRITDILMTEKVRQRLFLTTKPKHVNGYVIFQTPLRKYIMMLGVVQDPKRSDACLIGITAFEKGRYTIKATDAVEEFAKEKIAYLKDVLNREEYLVQYENAPITLTQPIFNFAKDEMMGLSVHIREMGRGDWAKLIFMATTLVGLTIALFYWQFDAGAWLSLAGIITYLALELPSRLSRRIRTV